MDTSPAMHRSRGLAERASLVAPGGVTAGGRFDASIGRAPYFARGRGSWLWDIDGREYLDFTSSQGASVLGHGDERIRAAVERGLDLGTLCTIETEYHVELAERVVALAHADRVRFAVSGTEATMAALRVARAATGRPLVLKFDGHFHGMHEGLFFSSSTPERPYESVVPSLAGSAGIPTAFADLVLTVPFNDREALRRVLDLHGAEIACVILEPVAFNMGCVPADRDWLLELRDETARRGIILIFDEVLSAFRERYGGAGDFYGVQPDLATWGKAIGAGWPIAALTGRADLMDLLNPAGSVVVSGTYTGQLCPVLAALASLDAMAEPGFFDGLDRRAGRLAGELETIAARVGVALRVQRFGSTFGLYFGVSAPVTDYRSARQADALLHERFCVEAHNEGLYFHLFAHRAVPMHYRLTSAHSDADLTLAIERLDRVFTRLATA